MSNDVSSSPLMIPRVNFISVKFLVIRLFTCPNTSDRPSALSFKLALGFVLINLLLTLNLCSFKDCFSILQKSSPIKKTSQVENKYQIAKVNDSYLWHPIFSSFCFWLDALMTMGSCWYVYYHGFPKDLAEWRCWVQFLAHGRCYKCFLNWIVSWN